MRREDTLAKFKAKIRDGSVVLGMQHNSGSAAIVELLGYNGFDFVIIDMEHGTYSISTSEQLVRVAEGVELAAFVRVLHNDPLLIMQAMDAGAHGVVVPHVRSRADCEAALASMRFAPDGTRGKTAGSRAARWGSTDWLAYQRWANEEPLMIPLIEDREAINDLDAILGTPGIEIVMLGPGDLSQSYGEPGLGLRSEAVMSAFRTALRLCGERGISLMTMPAPDFTNEFVLELIAEGLRVVAYGVDLSMFGASLRTWAKVRT